MDAIARMNDEELRGWLLAWRSAEYDISYDSALAALKGRPFGNEEVATVLRWKLARLWPRKAEDFFRANNDNAVVLMITARAFNEDAELALTTLCALKGVGPV